MKKLRFFLATMMIFMACSVHPANVGYTALIDVADECRSISGADSIAMSLDSIAATHGRSIDIKTSLNAILDAVTKLYNDLDYNGVVKVGMICSRAFADNQSMSRDEIRIYIHILDYFGYCCQRMGLYRELSDSYFHALDIARRENLEEEQAILLNNIGAIYYRIKDLDKATEMYTEAIRLNQLHDCQERLFVNYNNMSSVYVKRNNLDKGLEFAYLALHQLDSVGDADMSRLMLRNIASIYSMKGMKAFAISMIRKITEYQEEHCQEMYLVDSYRMLGRLYIDTGRLDSAAIFLNKGLLIEPAPVHVDTHTELLKGLAEVSALRGDFASGYRYLQRYAAVKDSINANDNKNRFDGLVSLYEDQRRQRTANEGLSAEKSKLIVSAVIVLALAIIAAAFAIWRMRRSKQAEISALEQQILLLDTQIRESEGRALAGSIENMRSLEYVTRLTYDLKALLLKINPKSTEVKAEIRDILMRIGQYEVAGGIDEFNATFKKVHPLFYDNLMRQFGNLTPKELRLCALIRMGLSTKSIADITFREPRSVDSARNRLRKKFGLQQQEDLTAFLMRF